MIANWYVIVGILSLGTLLSVTAARQLSAPLPKYKKLQERQAAVRTAPSATENAAAAKQADASEKSVEGTPQVAAAEAEAVEWDGIWKNSLFKDDRSEAEPEAVSENTEISNNGVVPPNPDFELVGIACVGSGDDAEAVAIIAQIRNLQLKTFPTNTNSQQANNNNNRPNRWQNRPDFDRGQMMRGGNMQPNATMENGGQNNMRRFPPQANGAPVQQMPQAVPNNNAAFPNAAQQQNAGEDRRVTRNIYHVGDAIGTTGYTVKKILPAENKVLLDRGGATVVLGIDVRNVNNSVRRQNVQNEEIAKRTQKENALKQAQQQAQRQAQQQANQRRMEQQRAEAQKRNAEFQRAFQERQRAMDQQNRAAQQTQQDIRNILQNMNSNNNQQNRRNVMNGRLNDGSLNNNR